LVKSAKIERYYSNSFRIVIAAAYRGIEDSHWKDTRTWPMQTM